VNETITLHIRIGKMEISAKHTKSEQKLHARAGNKTHVRARVNTETGTNRKSSAGKCREGSILIKRRGEAGRRSNAVPSSLNLVFLDDWSSKWFSGTEE
jgi:hypothetical protein